MIFIGFLIGFMGYLPPGNINLTVVQMSATRSKNHLWYFILFASLMEFIYCFGSLLGMKYLLTQSSLVLFMQWASVVMFGTLAILSFIQKIKPPGAKPSGVRRGIVIAIVNPLQIPFWLIWGVYVMNNHWVESTYPSIAFFSLITAAGALSILWLYAVAGSKLQSTLSNNQRMVNVSVGVIFSVLAVVQFIKLVQL